MTTSTHRFVRSAGVVLAVAATLVAASCAKERPAINRVQPNYFDKSFFIGADYKASSDDPEFYSLATLVDVGYGAGQDGLFTSTYAQPLTRVKWTVQENLLVARLAYERIANSDGKGTGKATNDGVVVAAYPIEKHFDIQRNYNPSTGEQTNVIDENMVDRPWYERQYIRVDWSKNLSTDNYDFDTLSQIGAYGGVRYEPLAYNVTDPGDENAPHFDAPAGYLDVTNKAFAQPQMIDLSQLGWDISSFPACMIGPDMSGGGAPVTQCSPVELTIRQSFLQVKPYDYEPADWDGNRFQAYGAFTNDRYGYARDYGMTDTQWHRFINRYDLWNRSHVYADPDKMTGPTACFTPTTTPSGADPHRDLDHDGTEDECASVGRGSHCDTFRQACTLPYRDRMAVTIPWYYGNGGQPEYFEPSARATLEWDVAMRSAIQSSRYAECVRTGGTTCASEWPVYFGQMDENADAVALVSEIEDCRNGRAYPNRNCNDLAEHLGQVRGYSAGVVAVAMMPPAIVLCHSPVESGDNTACGSPRLPPEVSAAMCFDARATQNNKDLVATCDAALNARRGDLRFHLVNSIASPQSPSPWGIMVDSVDPLDGHKVAASINVWTHVTDLVSQSNVDVSRYIKGELATEDITEGTYVHDWALAAEAASKGGAVGSLTSDDLDNLVADFVHVDTPKLKALRDAPAFKDPQLKAALQKVNHELSQVRGDAYAPSAMRPIYDARRKHAIGTATEAALTTPMMQSFAGLKGQANSEQVMNLASPLRGSSPALLKEIGNRQQLALAERGACMLNEAPAPLGIADLATVLEEKFGQFDKTQDRATQLARAEKMRKYLAQRLHYSVIAHEMGHSIGLRHNFVSSSDAFNYRPQYWQLRTDNGTNLSECTQLVPDGSCVGPRYFDPITDNERKNLIGMFMNSSTMEYPGEVTQDLIGIGAYDFAAARFFYGDVVAVFGDDSYKLGTDRAAGTLDKLDNFGGILGFRPTIGSTQIHYAQLQKNFDLIGNCQDINPNLFQPASWNADRDGTWSPLLDGMMVSVGGKFSRCKQQPVDYVQWAQLRDPTGSEPGAGDSHAIDPDLRVRVPYGFATDRWADLGNLSVYRHDNGADPYELFAFLITQQEVNHIFDNYRRNRVTFNVRAASQRSLSRYNEKLRDAAKGLGLMVNVYRDFATDMGYDFETLWPYIANESYHDNILASGLGFDHFSRQLARPESGPHYLSAQGPGQTGKPILMSVADTAGNPGIAVMNVPNGVTGYFSNVSVGGRPLENALASNKGEYNSDYTVNSGSYYDKAWTSMLMTESVDNFISSSRRDFLDARYRSVSVADVFPDGYRRWLSTNLTGDEELKGPRVASNASGTPLTDKALFPSTGLGWTSWWRASPQVCFPSDQSLMCGTQPVQSVALESQVGWEQQKFLIAWTLQYLPENQQQSWINSMSIWEIGADTDPGFPNRVEFHNPDGRIYVAQAFGSETLFGKKVLKGIGARVLEYANELMGQAYDTTPGPDYDNDGKPDWLLPVLGANGQPRIKYDPGVQVVTPEGNLGNGRPGCNATDDSSCTCTSNRACIQLARYLEVPFFMRQAMRDYGLAPPSMKGLY